MKRRQLLRSALGAGSAGFLLPRKGLGVEVSAAIELAHSEIWRRFVDRQNVMIDFAGPDGAVSLPSPEECRLGKPNALGWWSPIENGAMFNGLYMDAMVTRWRVTRQDAAADKARRLMKGLLFLNSISDVKGFVARGAGTDGRSHYPMGSNDQTFPWFYGLWRYLDSGLPTADERALILKQVTTTADAIMELKWQMPAEPPFGVRGGFGGFSFESSPRLLFVCKFLHRITQDDAWDARYRAALHEAGGREEKLTRLEWCERGMKFETGGNHAWTGSCSVCALRGLWEMEEDGPVRAHYARGLQASADAAMQSLPFAQEFDNNDNSHFEHDWRVMNSLWRPQQTEQQAQDLAHAQLKLFAKMSPRRPLETRLVRDPAFAAWIVTLAPDKEILRQRVAALEKVMAYYDCTRLVYSQFFPLESAWWRCKEALAPG